MVLCLNKSSSSTSPTLVWLKPSGGKKFKRRHLGGVAALFAGCCQIGSGAAIASRLDGRFREVALEEVGEPGGDHEAADEGEGDCRQEEEQDEDSSITTLGERFTHELTHFAGGFAGVLDGTPGVVELCSHVVHRRTDRSEVAPLERSLDRVNGDGQSCSEQGNDDCHVPEIEDSLHELLGFFGCQFRLFTSREPGSGQKREQDEERHRKADTSLELGAPENETEEGTTLSSHHLARHAHHIAVPGRDRDVESEQEENQCAHRSVTFAKDSIRMQPILVGENLPTRY